jgi:hypothetical protein
LLALRAKVTCALSRTFFILGGLALFAGEKQSYPSLETRNGLFGSLIFGFLVAVDSYDCSSDTNPNRKYGINSPELSAMRHWSLWKVSD